MATLPADLDITTIPSSAALFSSSPPPPADPTDHQHQHHRLPNAPYTLPQIRAIHKALHAQADDLGARARTRVGASYRELLGTADSIVAMHADAADLLLPALGAMGARCGRGVVAGKAQGLRSFSSAAAAAAAAATTPSASVLSPSSLSSSSLSSSSSPREVWLGKVLLGLRETLAGVSGSSSTSTSTSSSSSSSWRRGGDDQKGGTGKTSGGGGGGRGEALILAARLYVLGRLLVKSLDGASSSTATSTFAVGAGDANKVAAARKSLENVYRGRLMRGIDAVLRTGSERAMKQGDVLNALAAYSLATSSGARDVLAHFLGVRAQAIAMALQLDTAEDGNTDSHKNHPKNPKDVLRALGLYAKTLLDVQALVPNRLTEALVGLKADRLLENASLREMEVLRLDIYKRWAGDEIQFYTPFIRHDDLDGKQAREMFASWAGKGADVLLQGLERTLEGMNEFKAVVELRTSLLRLWIAEGGKVRGLDPSEMLDRLRGALNRHLLRVLEARVAKLRLVGSEVSAALDSWRDGDGGVGVAADLPRSLWDVGSLDTSLSGGAARFTHDVVSRLHGRDDAVSRAVASYRSWFHVVDEVGQVVDQLRRQRWDNDADGEIEDEETIEERQRLLSKDDPRALAEHLDRLLVDAFARLDDQLTTLWKEESARYRHRHRHGRHREEEKEKEKDEDEDEDEDDKDDDNDNDNRCGVVAMYFVRLLRDIRAKLPDLEPVRSFGLSAVPSLHEAVARAVMASPVDEFAGGALTRRTVAGRSLWEGEPALPASPSPGAFRFLRNLAVAMGDAGGDLWSPAAVSVLKHLLGRRLSAAWLRVLSELDTPKKEQEEEKEEEEERKEEEKKEEEKKEEEGGKEEAKDEETTTTATTRDEEDDKADEKKSEAASAAHRDLLLQWLMDIYYLELFLGAGEGMKELEDAVRKRLSLEEDGPVNEKLVKASQDYFKKTSLLFGLLT
ncbi:hypothetical protein VTH82DRAFT_1173 [Thermothelomyces myriococcoides]